MKAAIAARVAALIPNDSSTRVTRVKGGLGELRVTVDGIDVVESNRMWYPTPASVATKVNAHLRDTTRP